MGRGVGKVLFQSVVAELMKMGYRNIYLWVLEGKPEGKKIL